LDSQTWWQRVGDAVDSRSFLLAVLHGGVQGSHYPSPACIEISRRLISLGVNVVVWSHAHVTQGVAAMGRGLVAYGLGNLMHVPLHAGVDATHRNVAYDQGLLLEFEPDGDHVTHADAILIQRNGLRLAGASPTPELEKWFGGLCRRPQRASYPIWWLVYRLKQDVFDRTMAYVRGGNLWRQLIRIRFRHLARFLTNLRNARRDATDV
jgi:hypothetical protein